MKGQIFSGAQPTGNLHLGNYLGAIKQWVALQEEYDCIFCIVDMHAITITQNADELRHNTREIAATYIAAGIDPKKNIIYNQSMVKQHAELAWILGCNTPMGWLSRMTQFKDKAGKNRDNAMLGLFSYPVLMAADILLFNTSHVPVGEDQKQHLELAREIATSFNHHYKTEAFVVPEPLIKQEAARVMSLRDGTEKMSKSAESDLSRINLSDDAETIAKKFKKAKADMEFDGIFYDKEKRPEISNLLTIYAALADISIRQAATQFAKSGNGDFKQSVADLAVEKLSPITNEVKHLMNDVAYLDSILKDGAEKAAEKAEKNLKTIKDIIGFVYF